MSESNNAKLDIHYINLDLHEGVTTHNDLEFRQLDHRTRKLIATLTAHNGFISLQNCRVDLWTFREDGHVVAEQCTVDKDMNEVSVVFTDKMLAIAPIVECEFVITYADASVLKFPHFMVKVVPTLVTEDYIDDVIHEDEFNLFFKSLALMEEWIAKFDTKYTSIAEAFRKQLEAIVQTFQIRGEDIDTRFNKLYNTLDKTIRDDLMATKNSLKAENEAYLVEARAIFAYNAKELEKRMNQLERKELDLSEITQQYRDICEQMRAEVEVIKVACLGVQSDLEELYDDMVALHEDMDEKLDLINSRFEEMESDFTKAQETRQKTFNDTLININALYTQSEAERQEAFSEAETERQEVFNEAEAERQEAEEIRVANENTRIANESLRETNFDEMQEQFNIFLTYRIIED